MCKTCTTFSARPYLQNDMDGGVAAALIEEEAEQRACPDLDAHWRLDEAMDRAEKAERERDEWKDSAIKAMADLERAEQPRPLTPDAITDEMVGRVRDRMHERGMGFLSSYSIRELLIAALTEPPARPEGAEDVAVRLFQAGAAVGVEMTEEQRDALADHLAAMHVRVVGEEQP